MTRVINSPCAASRARVDCVPYSSQSGFIDKPCCSQSTPARVRVREGLSPIRDHESYFRAWRVAKFGGDFDPIRVAVDEAAMAFSSGKSEKGKASDRRVWLKIANRVGLSGFLDAFDQRAYDPFRAVAGEHGCSYQRVVLAWELAQYERLYTIPSARNPHEINDSFAATGLELTCDELARLNRAVFGGSRLR